MTHTPTPWKVIEKQTQVGRCFCIGGEDQFAEKSLTNRVPSYACLYDDYGQGDNVTKANAEFIVRACNRDHIFDALVAALELILPMAKGYAAQNQVGNNLAFIELAEAVIEKSKLEK